MTVDLQKASMWKRVAAWMFDVILISILATGFGLILSGVMGYDEQSKKMDDFYTKYEAEYNVDFNMTQEKYDAMTPQEQDNYKAACEAVAADKEMNETYTLVVNQSLIIVSIGILLSIVALEFVVPMLFGNGQTIGKKIFAIGVMRNDYVKVNGMQMFARAILGKYTIETMFPLYLVILSFLGVLGLTGTLIVIALFLVEVIMLGASKNNSQIHDVLAGTIVVDMTSQRIFESVEARIEFSKRIHAEAAARKSY